MNALNQSMGLRIETSERRPFEPRLDASVASSRRAEAASEDESEPGKEETRRPKSINASPTVQRIVATRFKKNTTNGTATAVANAKWDANAKCDSFACPPASRQMPLSRISTSAPPS